MARKPSPAPAQRGPASAGGSPARSGGGLPVAVAAPAGAAGRSAAPGAVPAVSGKVSRPGRGGRSSLGRVLLFLLLVAPAAFIVLPTTLVVGIGMVPTIVALIVDRDPEKIAALTVGPLNFCGVLPWLITLWRHHHTVREALSLLGDPLTLLTMFGGAALGWALYFIVPPAIAAVMIHNNKSEIKRMQDHQGKLIAEWGIEVNGKSGHFADPTGAEDTA